MGKQRRYTPEQIINKLREAEVLIGQGKTIGEAARKLGVTEQTYYRWRKKSGGMGAEHLKELKRLQSKAFKPPSVRGECQTTSTFAVPFPT